MFDSFPERAPTFEAVNIVFISVTYQSVTPPPDQIKASKRILNLTLIRVHDTIPQMDLLLGFIWETPSVAVGAAAPSAPRSSLNGLCGHEHAEHR